MQSLPTNPFAAPDTVASTASSTTLAGAVTKVRFARGAFGIVELRPEGDGPVALVAGPVGRVAVGEWVVATGRWEVDPRFGRQFKATGATVAAPTGTLGLVACVAELVDGVGPVRATRFVDGLGGAPAALARLEATDPGATPAGLSDGQWVALHGAWQHNVVARRVDVGLADLGLTPAMIGRLRGAYGADALTVVRTRPYDLAYDLDGIGFRRADDIAAKVGIERTDPARLSAALAYTLHETSTADGHTFVDAATAATSVRTLCQVPVSPEQLATAADDLVRRRVAVVSPRGSVALRDLVQAETTLAQRLFALHHARPLGDHRDDAIDAAEAAAGFRLADEQRAAMRVVYDRQLVLLTGGPGVGKTTVTKTIVALVTNAGASVALCAPTGRAARRMREATGHDATTIHRLLQCNPGQGGFLHSAQNPLPHDVVLVDETSMVDVELGAALLAALGNRTRLILVGDKDQLPPVGPGAPFRDALDSPALAAARVVLRQVHRQAQGSRIVGASREILAGSAPVPSPPGNRTDGALFLHLEPDAPQLAAGIVSLVATDLVEVFGADFRLTPADIMVVAPMRKGAVGVTALNQALRARLNPRGAEETLIVPWGKDETKEFRVGDRVMQTVNDNDRMVVNGEMGTVASVCLDKRAKVMLTVDFLDGTEMRRVPYERGHLANLDLAYCSTVHKVQGSQFPCVVVVLHDAHYPMLERSLFYTAITRAERLCLVVGTKKAMVRAAKSARNEARRTMLPALLETLVTAVAAVEKRTV